MNSKNVVPLAGTWIETKKGGAALFVRLMSFPLRERGLKLLYEIEIVTGMKSFPLRERGLKQGVINGVKSMIGSRSPCGNVD